MAGIKKVELGEEKMGKNEICWAIFNGVVLLPFTIRTTRKQCIQNRLFDLGIETLRGHESCEKVVINKWSKEPNPKVSVSAKARRGVWFC